MTGETYRYGTVILEMGGKTERIEKQSEPLREEEAGDRKKPDKSSNQSWADETCSSAYLDEQHQA